MRSIDHWPYFIAVNLLWPQSIQDASAFHLLPERPQTLHAMVSQTALNSHILALSYHPEFHFISFSTSDHRLGALTKYRGRVPRIQSSATLSLRGSSTTGKNTLYHYLGRCTFSAALCTASCGRYAYHQTRNTSPGGR